MQCRALRVELFRRIACSHALYTGMLNCVRIRASNESAEVNAAVLQTCAETLTKRQQVQLHRRSAKVAGI